MIDLGDLVRVLAILSGCVAITEWRVRSMYTALKEKIADKEKLNQVIQRELKEDIARLEAKIDTLITIQLHNGNSHD